MPSPLLLFAAAIQISPLASQPSTWREIEWRYETSSKGPEGSSSSSSGRELYRERVLSRRGDGIEIEYDLSASARPDERARQWRFPARVFRSKDGGTSLLNAPELELRLGRWLKAAKIDRSACGRMIFTWNMFRIECDPRSILGDLAARGLPMPLVTDGLVLTDPDATGSAPLRQTASGQLAVTLTLDADKARKAQADTDVTVGEITGTPVTLANATTARAKEQIAGTIHIIFDAPDRSGMTAGRTRVTTMTVRQTGGQTETRSRTDTLRYR